MAGRVGIQILIDWLTLVKKTLDDAWCAKEGIRGSCVAFLQRSRFPYEDFLGGVRC